MTTVTANSVGTCWRADVLAAALKGGGCRVVDLRGNQLAQVTTRLHGKGIRYYVNSEFTPYAALWELMHKWSDVIAKQHSEDYKNRMEAHESTPALHRI